jgi:TonB family protein
MQKCPLAAFIAAISVVSPRVFAADLPPRPATELQDAVLKCHAIHSRNGPVTGTVEITISVDAAGRATGVATPPGTDLRVAAAAQCVGLALRYQAAVQADIAVPGQLTLSVQFPTLPSLKHPLRSTIDYCHAPWARKDRYEGTMDLIMRVGRDGKVKEYLMPAGTLPWMTEAAKCVADRLEFYPASLRTTTVESWAILPLEFNLTMNPHFDAEVTPPTLRSSEEAVLDAYRRCYPAERTETARIEYRITITKGGRVRKAEVLNESGDPALDEAGICILRSLAFIAARRNGRAVESTLNWPILVRPPG